MFSKFFKKPNKLQDITIGGGTHFLKCSSDYLTERDEENTVLIYPKGDEAITLRITVFEYTEKQNDQKPTTGIDFIKKDLTETSIIEDYGDKFVEISESRVT